MLQILLALVAGMLTIAAPCILLPLPILLGTSVGQRSKSRPVFITLGFVVTFSLLGITINALVQNLGLNPNTLRDVAVVLLAVFSVFMIWPAPFERLMTHATGLINKSAGVAQRTSSGNWGGFLTGIIIGVIWAPCAGPILASILTLIAQETDTTKALLLLIAYSAGAGLPMLLVAYGGQYITTKIRAIARYATRLQQIFGILLLGLAVAIYFQYDTKFQAWLVEKLPTINSNLEETILKNITPETAPTENGKPSAQKLPLENYGLAPEFTGIENWLNTDNPLTLQELRGKVVLIDFWTYSCINCIRTLPYVTKWYDTYKDQGFVVVGVHTPEFAFEKDPQNVARAIKQFNIRYPVAQDNNYATWTAYNNHYWPAHYLLDKNGAIVETHFGEGNYKETEATIQQLLNAKGPLSEVSAATPGRVKTPEIYFGTSRQEYLSESQQGKIGQQTFVLPGRLNAGEFALAGAWNLEPEKAVLTQNGGVIKLHFNAGKAHMVANSAKTQSIVVRILGYPDKEVMVKDAGLYTLFDSTDYGDHVLEIFIPESGFEAYTFTFG